MTPDLLDRLRASNPAAATELTTPERATKAALAARLTDPAGTTPVHPHRRRTPLILVAATVGILTVAGVFVFTSQPTVTSTPQALGSGTLSAADIAQWTNAPSPMDARAPVADNCAQALAQNPGLGVGPATILNSDLRGDVGSVIIQNGDYIAWCVGTDSIPMYLLLDGPGYSVTTPAPNAITLGPSGGRVPPDGYGFAAGTAGSDVTSIVLHEDGLDVVATVENGWWSAWWPSNDESAIIDGTFTVGTSDGSSASYEADTVQIE